MSRSTFRYNAAIFSGNIEICFKISSSSDTGIQNDMPKIAFLGRQLFFKPKHYIEIILVTKTFDKLLLHIW